MEKKKIAVVTGASSGIGREFARLLSKKKGIEEIWCLGRNIGRLNELKAEIGDRARTFSMDLTDRNNFGVISDIFEEEQPQITWLVNCAGFAKFCDYADIDLTTSLNMIDLNVCALTAMGLLCLPYMEKGAHIVNMASQAAFQPLPYQNIYSSTKAFVRNYTRALNRELRPRGICATAVCAGWMETRLIERASIGAKKGTTKFPHITSPDVVAKKALRDAKKNKDMSIYGGYVKLAHLLAKFLPQKTMMSMWLSQQDIK